MLKWAKETFDFLVSLSELDKTLPMEQKWGVILSEILWYEATDERVLARDSISSIVSVDPLDMTHYYCPPHVCVSGTLELTILGKKIVSFQQSDCRDISLPPKIVGTHQGSCYVCSTISGAVGGSGCVDTTFHLDQLYWLGSQSIDARYVCVQRRKYHQKMIVWYL